MQRKRILCLLLLLSLAMAGCHNQSETITAPAPEGPALFWTGIGINGHMDKSGAWVPAWAYVTPSYDTVGYWNTEIEATTFGQYERDTKVRINTRWMTR